jgi:hypothetical protein
MSQEAVAAGILVAVASMTIATRDAQLSAEVALGISASMGVVGGTVSALVMAGDASASIRRVAICVLTTMMIAPMIVFMCLEAVYDGSRAMIPVVTTSGVAGVITWPITDKLARAFASVSAARFAQWALDTARLIIGRGP